MKKDGHIKFYTLLECIMKSFDEKTVSGYDIEILQDEIWITEKVQNVMFLK